MSSFTHWSTVGRIHALDFHSHAAQSSQRPLRYLVSRRAIDACGYFLKLAAYIGGRWDGQHRVLGSFLSSHTASLLIILISYREQI